ncbi:MAG: putative ABC transporter ATP-binding protein YxlF [Verrucomicrobia subdivision 3 bacterium]|nr:putative ABC transporter ATP-binding protein YxlF [Limisphaerales bacterium]MCS1413282.1 putative ABC transporter ATP-binding protein YxlF [Limisphaerales bacterium]
MNSDCVIEVKNLSKRYSGQTAVNDISFQVNRGEIVGFLGPNGAGKSSTIRILATYQSATTGTVRVAGHDVFRDPQAVQQAIGYMPENNPLPLEMRVREYLRFRARLKRLPRTKCHRMDEVIEACGLQEVRNRIIGQLSRGYRQRVGLADALVHEPALAILDEPTAGLDPNQIRSVRELIKSLAPRMTVLISTHILPEVSLTCDRVIILHQGHILTDESTETLQTHFREFSEIITEVAGPAQEIQQALQSLDEVSEVSTETLGSSFSRFVIRSRTQRDLRTEVFDLMHQHQWRLRELHRREYPLEEIFSHLTVRSPAT